MYQKLILRADSESDEVEDEAEEEEEKELPKPLEGQNVVFTGELEHFKRKEAQRIIELLGGNPTNSVTRKTNFVVVGENPGSKFAKAQKLGIKMLNEQEFISMLREFAKTNPEVAEILKEKGIAV